MANTNNSVESYVIEITPQFNVKEYENEKGKLARLLTKDFSNGIKNGGDSAFDTYWRNMDADRKEAKLERAAEKKAREEEKKRKAEERALKEQQRQKEKQVAEMNGKLAAMYELAKKAYSLIVQFTERLSEVSNKLITGSSAFVDADTKSIMARFGVSSSTALGISNIMDIMGISTSDLTSLTGGQMQYFTEMIKYWTEGLAKIDQSKLSKFNDVTQSFEKMLGQAKLDLIIATINILAENETAIQDFYALTSDLVNEFVKIAQSDTFSKLINLIITFLNTIMFAADIIMKVLSFITDAIDKIDNFIGGSLLGGIYGAASSSSTINNSSSTVTITQTNNNSFSGNDTTTYAIANAISSSENSYLTRFKQGTI